MSSSSKRATSDRPTCHVKHVLKNIKAKFSPEFCLAPSFSCPSSGNDVPSGFMAVYVGEERERFLIPTSFLNLPIFIELLNKAEEEFQFKMSGGIVLPCEADFFRELLNLLQKNKQKYGNMDRHELSTIVHEKGLALHKEENKLVSP